MPVASRATLNHDPVIDELFSDESERDIGGDDEQLPPLSPSFYE